jgi:hypothetical protein
VLTAARQLVSKRCRRQIVMARQIRLDLRGTAGRLPSGRRHTDNGGYSRVAQYES